MTKRHIDFPHEDPSSTSGSNFYRNIDIKQMAQMAQQQKHLKQMQNQAFGQSQRFEFRKRVEAEIRNAPYAKTINGRDYERVQDTLMDALRHVKENNFSTDGYTWYINPDTMSLIRDLYDMFSRFQATGATIGERTFEFHGIQFHQGPDVPEGWLLLADPEFIERKPIRSHAMVLIEEIDAGYRQVVEIERGGQMNFRVINP